MGYNIVTISPLLLSHLEPCLHLLCDTVWQEAKPVLWVYRATLCSHAVLLAVSPLTTCEGLGCTLSSPQDGLGGGGWLGTTSHS